MNKFNENGWITCDERMPEPYQGVLVTTEKGERIIDTYSPMLMNFVMLTRVRREKAIAWMPLPEPYKPSRLELMRECAEGVE